nr:unnamed protein product [Digitaria exilis]
MKPSLTKRAKRRTTKPAATHCVLVTTVCWYASSVTAAPTHPIRNPLRFRSMPPELIALRSSLPNCSSRFALMLLRAVWSED